jgi:hypothetical protein
MLGVCEHNSGKEARWRMSAMSESVIDIAFDCLPLRSVSRLDVPLDASDALRRRAERIKAAIEAFGAERTYFLHNAHCIFRFANSEVDGICRLDFDGFVRTDAGDRRCEQTLLEIRLVSETCGGVPEPVQAWLVERVRRAVAIEFDRFLAAGQLTAQGDDVGSGNILGDIGCLGGMDV